ncbi:hypothetical protein MUN82_12860 [Hymenobacter aerilatus]|uniref:Uncharacterized protein n=1 Tax=Hymenobacter aerilatus TaxID=2932251 RepID=A0A8T9SQ43_9BACT|nr:hypothetical protein [Hymenobacter aerilatus]UOR03837.1 hypothetical protein MUN82_12860 [Hymenobacter aerilatus]
MQATILRELELPLPSASGVELVGEQAYIIGDDSPLLYQLNATSLVAGQPTTLFETAHFSTGRIPKAEKPDLECLTTLTLPTGESGLLAFGSGSASTREIGFWVPLLHGSATVYPLALGPLYKLLRARLPADTSLNLEAAAATAAELWLFQRGIGVGAQNVVFRLPLGPALDFIRLRTAQPPAIHQQVLQLPTVAGHAAGLSGATWYDGRLFVTASAEDTLDPVADGAVLGSLVGMAEAGKDPRWVPLVQPNGQPYLRKVEGVAVRRRLGRGHYELLLVTDDDAGGSTALVATLRV